MTADYNFLNYQSILTDRLLRFFQLFVLSMPPTDPKDASSGKIAEANAKDGLIKEAETSLTFNLSDDQPLSMWMGSSKATSATCKLVSYCLYLLTWISKFLIEFCLFRCLSGNEYGARYFKEEP